MFQKYLFCASSNTRVDLTRADLKMSTKEYHHHHHHHPLKRILYETLGQSLSFISPLIEIVFQYAREERKIVKTKENGRDLCILTVDEYLPTYEGFPASWRVAKVPTARYGAVAIMLDGLVYLIGGFHDPTRSVSPTVERFDEAKGGEWRRVADMHHPRTAHVAMVWVACCMSAAAALIAISIIS